MGIFIDTTHRSEQREILDDFSLKGELLRDTLDKLGSINKWLGGNSLTLNGLRHFLKGQTKDKEFTIVDIGCGHGDILRLVAKFGRSQGYRFKLIGIDANQDAMDYATELSVTYPELSFRKMDIFSAEFQALDYDIVLTTFFLHHFKEEEILRILGGVAKKATLGIVANDLQRSAIAYHVFKLLGLFIPNHMIVHDGLISILRAFKRDDLVAMSEKLNVNYEISWKWAFRYQWLITCRSNRAALM